MKYNFGFGDSFAVADALKEQFGQLATSVANFHPTYPPVQGFPQLNDRVKRLVKDLTGKEYKHVLLTHGATGAISLSLKYFAAGGADSALIDQEHFIFYPHIVSRAGLVPYRPTDRPPSVFMKPVRLTALPSNPRGELTTAFVDDEKTIWDGCYFSPIYMNVKLSASTFVPPHRVMVGSFGKLLGLNGCRIGWLATDDSAMYDRLVWDQVADTMGVSTLGLSLVDGILKESEHDTFQMQSFMARARTKLNHNREALRRLEKFGGDKVPENGMFWLTKMDERARGLLEKAEVKVIDGAECGAPGCVRFTLGQTPEQTGAMVQAVLKADRRRK